MFSLQNLWTTSVRDSTNTLTEFPSSQSKDMLSRICLLDRATRKFLKLKSPTLTWYLEPGAGISVVSTVLIWLRWVVDSRGSIFHLTAPVDCTNLPGARSIQLTPLPFRNVSLAQRIVQYLNVILPTKFSYQVSMGIRSMQRISHNELLALKSPNRITLLFCYFPSKSCKKYNSASTSTTGRREIRIRF